LDPANLLVLFSGSWPGNSSGIAGLKFAVTQPVKEEDGVVSAEVEDPNLEQPKPTASAITVLYAVNEEATIAVLDGATGECLGSGPRQPEVSSKMLCIDVLGGQVLSKLRSKYLFNMLLSAFPVYEGLGLPYLSNSVV